VGGFNDVFGRRDDVFHGLYVTEMDANVHPATVHADSSAVYSNISRSKPDLDSTRSRRLVDLEHVDVRIAGATVLQDIDWRLHSGARWGVIGANGSGKTTFLALVAGALWPAPGRGARRYDFGDGIQTDAVEARRRITLVGSELQNRYARWDWTFTAEEVVLSGVFRTDIPRRRPAPADRIRAQALLRDAGLADVAARSFLQLSRGEQRRVLIARALAFTPAVLLLDEPASGLDRRARADLDATIAAIGGATTIVCSGHERADLPATTTDVLLLDAGRIAHCGRHTAISTSPPAGRADTLPPPRSIRARAAPAPALIDVRNVDVWLHGRRVLHDVRWRLDEGQHWLVSGANGAGKSTFLRLLHGQVRPAIGGRITWPGLGDPRNVWRLRRSIGYVSPELQADYRYPATVRQCVASGIESSIGLTRALTASEADDVGALLDRFDLAALANRPLTSLSYGQMHRVLVARTLVNRPRILLLDEPWEGLDQQTRALVRGQIETAMAAGTQIVCASHILDGGIAFSHELEIADGRMRTMPSPVSRDDGRGGLRGSSASVQRRE
jgi:molybdate transport system ATP-binding protein